MISCMDNQAAVSNFLNEATLMKAKLIDERLETSQLAWWNNYHTKTRAYIEGDGRAAENGVFNTKFFNWDRYGSYVIEWCKLKIKQVQVRPKKNSKDLK